MSKFLYYWQEGRQIVGLDANPAFQVRLQRQPEAADIKQLRVVAQEHVRECLERMSLNQAVLFILMVAFYDATFANELKRQHKWNSGQLLNMPPSYQTVAQELIANWHLEQEQLPLALGL